MKFVQKLRCHCDVNGSISIYIYIYIYIYNIYVITFALSTFARPLGLYICCDSHYLVPLCPFISIETRLNDQQDISFSGPTTGQHGTNLGNVGLGSQTNNGWGRRGGFYFLYMQI